MTNNTETEIKFNKFISMVYQMRSFQKLYFKTRSKEALINSINAEKRVDDFIQNEFNNEMMKKK